MTRCPYCKGKEPRFVFYTASDRFHCHNCRRSGTSTLLWIAKGHFTTPEPLQSAEQLELQQWAKNMAALPVKESGVVFHPLPKEPEENWETVCN
jgi:hypothetical protein